VGNNFSDIELFWDRITRERMSEVGKNAPFDFMYRGEYVPENNVFRPVELGDGDASLKVDLVNVDMESPRIRIYSTMLGSTRNALKPGFADENGEILSEILEGTENDWGYDSSAIFFDSGRSYEQTENGLIQKSVYRPETTRDHSEDVYQDVRRIFGEDILSQL
jgi:hypothetical protein